MARKSRNWSVTVEVVTDQPLTEAQIDDAVDRLGSAVTADIGGTRALTTVNVTGGTWHNAVKVGATTVLGAFDGAEVEMIEAETTEHQERQLEHPVVPPLVGLTEAAQILGVSRQRAGQLAASSFPAPVATLAAGPVWRRSSIEAFARIPRRTGRPAKAS